MKFLLVLFVLLVAQSSSKCSNPPPAAGFQIQNYKGLWYEIAKYQTEGGAFFERNCTCTKINVGESSGSRTIYAEQTCFKNGKTTGVNATLIPTDQPGKFVAQISVNKEGYWVIELDENTAIEYDCK